MSNPIQLGSFKCKIWTVSFDEKDKERDTETWPTRNIQKFPTDLSTIISSKEKKGEIISKEDDDNDNDTIRKMVWRKRVVALTTIHLCMRGAAVYPSVYHQKMVSTMLLTIYMTITMVKVVKVMTLYLQN